MAWPSLRLSPRTSSLITTTKELHKMTRPKTSPHTHISFWSSFACLSIEPRQTTNKGLVILQQPVFFLLICRVVAFYSLCDSEKSTGVLFSTMSGKSASASSGTGTTAISPTAASSSGTKAAPASSNATYVRLYEWQSTG